MTVSITRKKTHILCYDASHKKQCESLPPEKKVKILQTDADAHKEKQESLSPEDKDLFVKNNVAAQCKNRKSLSPDQKAQVLIINAAKHKKHQESLYSKQNVKVMTIEAAACKKQYELLPPEKKARHMETITEQHHEHLTEEEKKILTQIRSVAATLYERVDLDKPTVEFLCEHFIRIQHLHWLIFIVVQQIFVWQYSMMNYNQKLIDQSHGTAFQT